jgi:hypothetical protein
MKPAVELLLLKTFFSRIQMLLIRKMPTYPNSGHNFYPKEGTARCRFLALRSVAGMLLEGDLWPFLPLVSSLLPSLPKH